MSDNAMPIGAVLAEIMSEPGQPSEPENDTTESVIVSMLTENTGRHLLDSGGAYGRAWERNQGVDFPSTPEVVASFNIWPSPDATWAGAQDRKPEVEISAYVSVYHYLTHYLDFDAEADAAFREWADGRDGYWLELMEQWADEQGEPGAEWHGTTVNTYNHDNNLSQDLQYTLYEAEDGEYRVLLQVHGGCDARGGYTAPRIFRVDPYSFLDDSRLTLYCDGTGTPDHNPDQLDLDGKRVGNPRCDAAWDSNGGYGWTEVGNADGTLDLDKYPVVQGTEGVKGKVVVDSETETAFCPHCGHGKLGIDPCLYD